MRLLTLSDIHENLTCVKKLRQQEGNNFDAIIVAGDIGGKIALSFFKIMETFHCPVFYVFGNWDNNSSYKARYSKNSLHLHHTIQKIGNFYLTGFSGCTAHWGNNPIASRIGTGKTVARKNKEKLFSLINSSGYNPRQFIIVTHERIGRLEKFIDPPLLHIFGHRHTPKYTFYKETHCLNTSVLDNIRTVFPRNVVGDKKIGSLYEDPALWLGDKIWSNANAGNYFIINIDEETVLVKRVDLKIDPNKWVISDHIMIGDDLIPEERNFQTIR